MAAPRYSPQSLFEGVLNFTPSRLSEPNHLYHRYQSALQGLLDIFSSSRPLEPDQLYKATDIFNRLVAQYEPRQKIDEKDKGYNYKRITLLRVTHDSVISKNSFLRWFFLFVEKEFRQGEGVSEERQGKDVSEALRRYDNLDSWSEQQQNELETSLVSFSDHLVNKFFLPLRVSALRTPQPTPASLSETSEQVTGTIQRLSTLRRACLIRDGHRCVISHKFDIEEAENRFERDKDNFKDDDGRTLKGETGEPLEVAHILPHSLTSLTAIGKHSVLSDGKKYALQILNVFDPDITNFIQGSDIDRPGNALTLTHNLRRHFEMFKISFESRTDQPQHTYKIDSVQTDTFLRDASFPVIRTLRLSPDRIIDPPSARLLAIHHAITRIVHLSAAGEYMEKIIRNMNEFIKMEGSPAMEHYLYLKFGGLLGEVPVY